MSNGRYVSYLRVSTESQGSDGHGIAAQRDAVERYLNGGQWELLAEYVEVVSGKRTDRPELEMAVRHAKATNATLVCAKLDRIGRVASRVLSLLDDAGVRVVFVDSPNAGKLELGVRAVVAEEEGRAISERTKAGLAAAKARGVRLGCPNGAAALRRHAAVHGNAAGVAGAKARADRDADNVRFAVEELLAEGVTTNRAIARALNDRKFESPRGGSWHPTSVKRLRDRLAV